MNKLSYIIFLAVAVLLYSSCKKDTTYSDPGTFKLSINAEVNDNPFALNNVYYDVNSYRYEPNLLKIYLSNITLIKEDGSEVLAKDVALLDWDDNSLGEAETVSIEVDPGNYTGIRFWIGVDSTLNNMGPASYPTEHPLSVAQGTYWAWNTGFRFMMYEGHYDTIPNGTGSIPQGKLFNYHCGTNQLYTEADLSNAQQNFTVDAGGSYTYNLNLDVNRIWYSDQDTVWPMNDPYSHTTEDVGLARRVIENTAQAFSMP